MRNFERMGQRGPDDDGYCTEPLSNEFPVELDGRAFRGDLDIRIDAQGGWHYNQSLIERKAVVCLFASMLVRDKQLHYWLVTPTELGRIEVDDAPLIAIDLFITGDGTDQDVSFCTNIDQLISVTAKTPLVMKPSPVSGQMAPYVTNANGIEAKLTRQVYYSLVEAGVVQTNPQGEEVLGIWSDNTFFPLGAIFEPDA